MRKERRWRQRQDHGVLRPAACLRCAPLRVCAVLRCVSVLCSAACLRRIRTNMDDMCVLGAIRHNRLPQTAIFSCRVSCAYWIFCVLCVFPVCLVTVPTPQPPDHTKCGLIGIVCISALACRHTRSSHALATAVLARCKCEPARISRLKRTTKRCAGHAQRSGVALLCLPAQLSFSLAQVNFSSSTDRSKNAGPLSE